MARQFNVNGRIGHPLGGQLGIYWVNSSVLGHPLGGQFDYDQSLTITSLIQFLQSCPLSTLFTCINLFADLSLVGSWSSVGWAVRTSLLINVDKSLDHSISYLIQTPTCFKLQSQPHSNSPNQTPTTMHSNKLPTQRAIYRNVCSLKRTNRKTKA